MNNLKKLGLSALAGSLVATSAYAGEMSVSGSAKLTYTDKESGTITGTPFGMNKLLGFSGSGEMDNGWNMSVYFGNNGSSQSSATLSVDMGDVGKFTYDSGAGGHGIGSIDDKTPTAAEEIWDNISYGTGHDGFRVGIGNSGALVYGITVAGVTVSADYVKQGGGAVEDGATGSAGSGSGSSIALTMSPTENLSIGYGRGDKGTSNATLEDEQQTAFATFTMGPGTFGIQRSYQDSAGTEADWTVTQWGASFAVNDSLSVSYGERSIDLESTTDEDNSGIAASYTMGSMSITAQQNSSDNHKGSATSNKETTEIAVSFAF